MDKNISFKNDQQKRDSIISTLRQLKESIGWKVIVKALESDVRAAEARLHDDIPLVEGETMKEWQIIRKGAVKLINLPNELIEENKKKEAFNPKLDPYE